MRLKVFAWYPVPVYTNRMQRDGFRWLKFVYLDIKDRNYYTYLVDLPFDCYIRHCKTSVLVK